MNRYHPRYYEMLVSTAGDGFHIFKPNFEEDSDHGDEEDANIDKEIKLFWIVNILVNLYNFSIQAV